MSQSVVLSCPGCATRFSAPVSQFMPDARQVRCSKCRHVWFHALLDTDAETPPPVSAPVVARAAPGRPVVVAAAEAAEAAAAAREGARETMAEADGARARPAAPGRADGGARRGGWLGPLL